MSRYTDSAVGVVSMRLPGVLIHDPLDPGATLRAYPYGADSRESALDVDQGGTVYAGRTYQVVDFGQAEAQSEVIRLVVPSGPDYQPQLAELQAWQRARRSLHLRDNRGRNVRGTMSGLRISDQSYGADVQFTFTRVDAPLEQVI